jgi:hypothetical protein
MKTNLSKEYGRLVADFVNTDSTEEAVLLFLKNLQQLFSFSLDFYEKVKTQVPSIDIIAASMIDAEKKLLQLIVRKNEIVEQLNDQFKLINYGIENYDPVTRTVSLMSLEWNRDSGGGPAEDNQTRPPESDDSGFLQTLKLLGLSIVDGPVSIKIDAIRSEIENLLGPLAAGQINNLIAVGHEIEELMLGMEETKYAELQLLAEKHRLIFEFHKKIGGIQAGCSELLQMVTNGRPYHDIPALVAYLEIYNRVGSHRLMIGDRNRLIPVLPIDEPENLTVNEIDRWVNLLQKVISYCLIEFLKIEKNRAFLKKCRTCSRFFIARQPKRQKYCTKACRQRRNKPPPKGERPAKRARP